MTKKDYELIAEAIRNKDTRVEIVDSLVEKLLQDNPKFDKDKFYYACNVNPNK